LADVGITVKKPPDIPLVAPSPGGSNVDRLTALYTTSYDKLVRLAYVLVDTNEQAEEIVQDAFARALLKREYILDPERYVQRAVVNACRDALRRRRTERLVLPRLRRDHPATEDEYLADALASLPAKERIAITLRYYADMPVDQIAIAMSCPAGTVKTLLHRGTTRLRGQIKR
jgi:RNA polymerase sigma factor (sigma-70 family)